MTFRRRITIIRTTLKFLFVCFAHMSLTIGRSVTEIYRFLFIDQLRLNCLMAYDVWGVWRFQILHVALQVNKNKGGREEGMRRNNFFFISFSAQSPKKKNPVDLKEIIMQHNKQDEKKVNIGPRTISRAKANYRGTFGLEKRATICDSLRPSSTGERLGTTQVMLLWWASRYKSINLIWAKQIRFGARLPARLRWAACESTSWLFLGANRWLLSSFDGSCLLF